ncbi:UNVERIFIED_CONTAM: hypothetical protein HDU68_005333 [Siphonaria sp. JEL0065]|nr:hypothetical protein HDU68_005333 [Siphonaria sp. JEL0065]
MFGGLFRKKDKGSNRSSQPPPSHSSPAPSYSSRTVPPQLSLGSLGSASASANASGKESEQFVSRLDPLARSERGLDDSSMSLGGSTSMSFMDEMMVSLDDKLALDLRSPAATQPVPAATQPSTNKYPALRSSASKARQTQPHTSTSTTAYSSMEDDILAAFDMIQVLDSPSAPAAAASSSGLTTTPYSAYQTPSRALSSPASTSRNGGLSITPFASTSNATVAKAYNLGTRTNSPSPYSPSSPTTSKPGPFSSSTRNNYNEPSSSSSPLPPPSTKFNRSQKANLLKEYEQGVEQARREKEEQEQARKIELAKALYFKDNITSSSSASVSSGSTSNNKNNISPQPLGKHSSLRPSSRNSRLPPTSSMEERIGGGVAQSGNRVSALQAQQQSLLPPPRSLSAQGAPIKSVMKPKFAGIPNITSYSSESEDSDDSEDNQVLAKVVSRPASMMEKSAPMGLGQRSLSALNVTNWLKGQQQQQQSDSASLSSGKSSGRKQQTASPESPTTPLSRLRRRNSQTRSLNSAGGSIYNNNNNERPSTPVISSPPITKRGPSMPAISATPNPTINSSPAVGGRVKSPLTPSSSKKQQQHQQQVSLGSANAATLQQLYQANQVKKLGETQQTQQQAQNAMMTYLAQMAVVQQTQMAALLAQQQQAQLQQLQQQQQQRIVVGMAPALNGAPVGMAVLGGGSVGVNGGGGVVEEKKKKRRGRSAVQGDDTFETIASQSTGSGGDSVSVGLSDEVVGVTGTTTPSTPDLE